MKKIMLLITIAFTGLVIAAPGALAYDGVGPDTETRVLPDTVVRAPDELAFTGIDDVAFLAMAVTVLLAVGLAFIVGGRRLSRGSA